MSSTVIIFYFIVLNFKDYSLHARSGTLWIRQHNVVKLVTILSKHTVASFCSWAKFLQVMRWISVITSLSNAGCSILDKSLIPHWFFPMILFLSDRFVVDLGQNYFNIRL